MNILESISQNNKKIPLDYRQIKTLDEIKIDLKHLNWNEVTNEHLFNLRSLIMPESKKIIKIELISDVDTGDLEIDDMSHSYWVNGVPTHNTVNIPEHYSYDDFKELYLTAWRSEIKGLTTYRANTMTAVLEEQKTHEYQSELEEMFVKSNGDVIKEDVKLPKEYYSKGYIRRDKNKKKWYINIAFADSKYQKPYAMFVHTNSYESTEVAGKVIEDMESLCRNKGIKEELIERQRSKYSGQTNVNKIARAIGLALRHNVPAFEIVGILEENPDGFSSFLFHVKKLLSKFIKDGTKIENEVCQACNTKNIIYQEGCKMCLECGWSACG